MHEHLGVLEALVVGGEGHVDEVGVVVDALEGGVGLVGVACEHLLTGELGHGVDELCIEEALFARAGLLGADFQLMDGFGGGEGLVDAGGGVAGGSEREDQGKREEEAELPDACRKFHNAPRGSACYFVCSRVMRRWRASHSSSGYWPFATERNCL